MRFFEQILIVRLGIRKIDLVSGQHPKVPGLLKNSLNCYTF